MLFCVCLFTRLQPTQAAGVTQSVAVGRLSRHRCLCARWVAWGGRRGSGGVLVGFTWFRAVSRGKSMCFCFRAPGPRALRSGGRGRTDREIKLAPPSHYPMKNSVTGGVHFVRQFELLSMVLSLDISIQIGLFSPIFYLKFVSEAFFCPLFVA